MAIRYDFDPMALTGIKVPKEDREAALADVATYVKEQILSKSADGESSVRGGRWKKKLTPGYLERKKEESGVGYADMQLTGDMLDALQTEVVGRKVRIEIAGDEADKAEGNLLGSYGRDPDPSKAREFMPHKKGQQLSPDIVAGVKSILKRYEEE